MPPRVHLSEKVPIEVERALATDFELVPDPVGADGIVAMLTVTVDDAYLEAAGPHPPPTPRRRPAPRSPPPPRPTSSPPRPPRSH